MWAAHLDLSDLARHTDSPALPGEPDLIFLFADAASLQRGDIIPRLAARHPSARLIGCSARAVAQDRTLTENGRTALAVGFERTPLRLVAEPLPNVEASFPAGAALGEALKAPDLAGLFVLSEGRDVNGTALIDGIRSVLGPDVVIGGGLAGNFLPMDDTLVLTGTPPGAPEVASHRVAALGLYGPAIRIAQGCAGGWDEFGPNRRITRSKGTVIYEFDGRPALDLYETYLGDEADALPLSGLVFPLHIWDDANPRETMVRTIMAIDREERSITVGGDVPEGWSARLMRGYFESLMDGANQAGRHARTLMAAQGVEPALCLFVSCIGRHLLLGQRTEEELEAVSRMIGDTVPIVGCYANGEFAPNNGSTRCSLHNQTVTLTLLAEAI